MPAEAGIIGEKDRYWNIKEWYHFVREFRLNSCYFLGLERHHFELNVVPLWHHSWTEEFEESKACLRRFLRCAAGCGDVIAASLGEKLAI